MKKRIFSIILLIAILSASLVSPAVVSAAVSAENAEIQVIASEDFSDGMTVWTNEYGNDFFVLNRKLNVVADNKTGYMSTSVASGITTDNCEVEFTMNIKSGGYFAYLPRYVDESTFYAVKFYPSKDMVLLQKRVNGGLFTDIKSVKTSLGFGRDYKVHLTLCGTDISLSIDGTKLFTANDISITSGKLAFGAFDTSASVDDVLVYRLKDVDYEVKLPVKDSKKIYVSPDGDDKSGDGSPEKPYATIGKAKEEAATFNDKYTPVDVIFKEGIYRIKNTIEFSAADSGETGAPIRYMAQEGADVTFTGAKKLDISKFTPVSGKAKEKLRSNIRDKVLQVNLSSQDFDKAAIDFTQSQRIAAGQRVKLTNVTLNGTLQSIARWPNSGYETIEDVENSVPPKIYYTNNIPVRWAEAKNFFVDGFLFHDWAPEWALVDKVDTLANSINIKSGTSYGIRAGGKWAAANLLEELDIPGEWYIDFDSMIMYYYPPHEFTDDDIMEIANINGSLVKINGAKNIEFDGIHFTMSNGIDGIGISVAKGSENITIRDCVIDNVNTDGIRIDTDNVTVDGCIINSVGTNGVNVNSCGNIEKLLDGNVIIKNCDISNASIYAGRNNTGGIITGDKTIGVVATNNVIHNCGNNAIRYRGIGHRFSYNEIYTVMTEAADAGAIYTGRSWNWYGTVAEYNLLHDLGQKKNTTSYKAMGMFWDDMNNGCEFIHNIVVHDGKPKTVGVSAGGTSDTVIVGNTVVNAEEGIGGNSRQVFQTYQEWEDLAVSTMKWNTFPILTEPYVKKYPKMATVLERIKENGGILKRENTVTDNLVVDCVKPFNFSTEMTTDATIERNTVLGDNYDIFVNPDDLDYRVKNSAKEQYGISDEVLSEDFDINSIGIQGEGKRELDPKYMQFNMQYPANGDATVTQDRSVISWSRAYMADRYTYTVAEDPDFNKIVASEETIRTSAQLENLVPGKTYYWKVTAHNMSRQYGCDMPAPEGVWSFTIDSNSSLDITALKLSVTNAEKVVAGMKEGNNPGEYRVGSIKALKEKIQKGKACLANLPDTQKEIDAIAYDISHALINLEGYVNAGYTTLNLSDDSPWVTSKSTAAKTTITKGNGQVKFDTTTSTEISLNKTLSNYNVMCFKTRVDNFKDNSWFAYGLRALDTESQIYRQQAYYILIKEDVFELQKEGEIYVTAPNNGKFKAGQWHDIKFGSITTENGVNMYFELDGEVIFDYLDKSSPQKKPGMFAMFVSSKENSVELAPADSVPTGCYTFSDAILKEIKTDAAAGGMLGTYSVGYSEKGEWTDNPAIVGDNGSNVRMSNSAKSSATWTMNAGDAGNTKLYKVYYYHIPTANGDKNVNVKLEGYEGKYETTIDLSQGEKGYVELGTFKFIDADYVGRLDITFSGSGEGEINVSNVKFELADSGENMLK